MNPTITDVRIPTVTRFELPTGKYRYSVDGETFIAESSKLYTHASVYLRQQVDDTDRKWGRQVGEPVVFLHTREDLAVKGNADANRIAKAGMWSRVPGVVTIDEPDTTPAEVKAEAASLKATWDAALVTRRTVGTDEADRDEQAAFDELVDFVEAFGLNGTGYDPR